MKLEIGAQAFTLKKELENNPEKVFQRLKEIGLTLYEPIILTEEKQGNAPFAFASKEKFPEMVSLYESAGLKAESCHIFTSAEKDPEEVASYILNAAEISGIRRYVLSGMPKTEKEAVRYADFMNRITDAGIGGCRLLYHNHGVEFRRENGRSLMDLLFENLRPETAVEIDFGWAWYGRASMQELEEKYFDKLEMIHLKDFNRPSLDGSFEDATPDSFSVIGDGLAYFDEVFRAVPGMKNFCGGIILDQDEAPEGILPALEAGFRNVSKYL